MIMDLQGDYHNGNYSYVIQAFCHRYWHFNTLVIPMIYITFYDKHSDNYAVQRFNKEEFIQNFNEGGLTHILKCSKTKLHNTGDEASARAERKHRELVDKEIAEPRLFKEN